MCLPLRKKAENVKFRSLLPNHHCPIHAERTNLKKIQLGEIFGLVFILKIHQQGDMRIGLSVEAWYDLCFLIFCHA